MKRKQGSELETIWRAGTCTLFLLSFPRLTITLANTLVYTERTRLEEIKELKQKLEDAKYELEVAQREGRFEVASRLRFATIPELERQLPKDDEHSASAGDGSVSTTLLHDRVTSGDIARVVARATGIPVQSLLKGEKEKLVHVSLPYPIHFFIKVCFAECVVGYT